MKVAVYLSDGAELDIAELSDEDALSLREDFDSGVSRTMTFDMDGATVVVARHHVVRIDFETGGKS